MKSVIFALLALAVAPIAHAEDTRTASQICSDYERNQSECLEDIQEQFNNSTYCTRQVTVQAGSTKVGLAVAADCSYERACIEVEIAAGGSGDGCGNG